MVGAVVVGAVAAGATVLPAVPKNLAIGLFEIERLMADTSKSYSLLVSFIPLAHQKLTL